MKIATFLILFALAASSLSAKSKTLWIGTAKKGNAIYRAELNLKSGRLSTPELAAEIGAPGFLTLSKDGTTLYAISSDDGGSVAAFRIEEDSSLTLLNTQPTNDGGPCHIALDHTGKILFTAQYRDGSVAAFPILEDGTIGERSALIKHSGSGPDPRRQKSPHPHWVGVSPDNRFLFVPDLGTDRVEIYQINHDDATLTPHGHGETIPGGGPRHMAFSRDGSQIFLLNEMFVSMSVFDFDATAGTMTQTQVIPALTEEQKEIKTSASEIRTHPNGRFVYSANRGHDSITAYEIGKDGTVSVIEQEPVRGAKPRNFHLDPSGRWLIAAGRSSNTLAVFEINEETGSLTFTGSIVNCPEPICIAW